MEEEEDTESLLDEMDEIVDANLAIVDTRKRFLGVYLITIRPLYLKEVTWVGLQIPMELFYKYDIHTMKRYFLLNLYYLKLRIIPTIEDVQFDIFEESTKMVKYLFWIRLVQRRWKKIYKDYKLELQQMKHPSALYRREIRGGTFGRRKARW